MTFRSFFKKKRIKLNGKEKTKLREKIFERDKNKCVICGAMAEDWHHQPFGADKSDELEKGVALCHGCHMDLHSHPKLGKIYHELVEDYLNGLYGAENCQ